MAEKGGEREARFGAEPLEGNATRFRVWAPKARDVAVEIVGTPHRTVAMQRLDGGIFEAQVEDAGHGTDYMFVLDGRTKRPDPRARFQPHGVHGPSRVVATGAFAWSDGHFGGVDLRDLVLYELHVGTFTPEGTYEGIIAKLPYIADLGVTAIELMPVAQFPGERN